MATLLKRLEVVFYMAFTERTVENILCKSFRELSNNKGTKKVQMWCDTLQPGQQLYKFKNDFILVLSSGGQMEEVEGDAIVNRSPYGDSLLTMEDLVSKLGLPSVMTTKSRMRKYRFYGKVWSPKVKFDVEFTVPPTKPLLKKALGTTKTILWKWIGSRPIPRKRKQMHT
jgi:hypothetical protein